MNRNPDSHSDLLPDSNPGALLPIVSPTEILPPAAEMAVPLSEQNAGPLRLPPDDPLWETAQAAAAYMEKALAEATRRAYYSDWRHFTAWCNQNRLTSLPATPGTVALYLTSLARPREGEKPRKAATITRRLTAINAAHKRADLDSPATMNHRLVADTLHGIRRTLGVAQTRKMPLTLDRIVRLLRALPDSSADSGPDSARNSPRDSLPGPIAAARDRALLLIGFAGGLRRSELAALRVEELARHPRGITLSIPRSKTDQEGEGREVEIPLGAHEQTCPVLALENWLKISGVNQGYVFRRIGRHGNVGPALDKDSVGRIVKKLVRRARLAHPEAYGGHSLRAGFVTEASANGATDRQIMKQTGHKSIVMVHRYAREDQKDRQAAAGKLGL